MAVGGAVHEEHADGGDDEQQPVPLPWHHGDQGYRVLARRGFRSGLGELGDPVLSRRVKKEPALERKLRGGG
jgi:hypothetical protein